MQINGVGNGKLHNSEMHQVTGCIHDHSASKKSGGAAAASSADTLQTDLSRYNRTGAQFSVISWLKNALSGSRNLLRKIWGENPNMTSAEEVGDKSLPGSEQVMAQEAMAGATVRQQNLYDNPYFSAVEDAGKEKQSIWDKMRVRFQSVAGQLTKQFSGRNAFQTKQQKPKEDLRRHSRYREDDLEIDCILTDDSYLLDSYDRKGKYSKLSAKK